MCCVVCCALVFVVECLLPRSQCGGLYGPMDKAPAYGAGDSGFESQYGLFCVVVCFCVWCVCVLCILFCCLCMCVVCRFKRWGTCLSVWVLFRVGLVSSAPD